MECLQTLDELCDAGALVLGKSEDGTEENVKSCNKLEIVETVWDMSFMGNGGLLLSQQTNIALNHLRKKYRNESSWGFYLQTDELVHEKDYGRIRKDIRIAHERGYDAVRFRYYHFWLNHNQIAISKRWYPQEIRAVKLNSSIRSFGDAQGFSGFTKIYDSDVHIFHYGHVRDENKREAKQDFLLKMIRPQEKLPKYKKREQKAFKRTETLPFYGSHPKVMKNRIQRFNDILSLPEKDQISIFDPRGIVDDELKSRIKAKNVHIARNQCPKGAITLEKKGLLAFLSTSTPSPRIPTGMRSPLARPWSPKQRMELLLWSHGVST